MENQNRLADNVNHYDAGHTGAPRKGAALLQGIAVCGRCGRQMSIRYTGPDASYPVYTCRADRDQDAGPLCQEVRALPVDATVEQILLDALSPDSIAIAVAALDHLQAETHQLERQWSLRRERARYEAERARRQYDAVEPENRLVARSLERVWEDKLRALEDVEREYERWRDNEPLVLKEQDLQALRLMGKDLPHLWHSPTTTGPERKTILRRVVRQVIIDQKRLQGQVWFKIVWQSEAITEHQLQRHVRGYADYADEEKLRLRVMALNLGGKMDKEIADILNAEGFISAHGGAFKGGNVHLLRKRWAIDTVKINGTGFNPSQWSDSSYSVQGAAARLGITSQTVFKYLARGLISGRQLAKGAPWQISLSEEQIDSLRMQLQRNRQSRKTAS